MLNNQTETDICIILAGSTSSDLHFMINMSSQFENVYYIITPNNPCGLKWHVATLFSRLFNPNAIIILGSDDVLSLNYLSIFYKYICNGYDLVGKRSWYIMNDSDPNIYQVNYTDLVDMSLGAGRMYSKKILDKYDWHMFEFLRDRCLDDLGYHNVKKCNGVILDDVSDACVLSVKGDWDQFNPFDKIYAAADKDNPTIEINKHAYESKWLDDNFGVNNGIVQILNI